MGLLSVIAWSRSGRSKAMYGSDFFIVAACLIATTMTVAVGHAEEDFSSAAERAQRAHERSMSDVMYQQEDFRALYYQNLEIIQLLKELRDEMHAVNARASAEGGSASGGKEGEK